MKVTITGRHLDLNDDLKRAVKNRIDKIGNQWEDLSHAEVVLKQEAHRFHVRLAANGTKQHFRASATDYDPLRAVDTAVRHIRDQAGKFRKKVTEHFKHQLSQREVLNRLEAEASD